MRPPRPSDLPRLLATGNPSQPRLTWYDDEAGPTLGERIELSGTVLTNWANKAANLLLEEFDLTEGDTVGLALPAHWRAAYWALATSAAGGIVTVGSEALTADVLVTDDVALAAAHDQAVLVHLPALSRAHPEASRAPRALDEARVLATYGDAFEAAAAAGEQPVALRPEWGTSPRVWVRASTPQMLADCLAAWAADGSVVLSRGEPADAAHRVRVEGVTVRA